MTTSTLITILALNCGLLAIFFAGAEWDRRRLREQRDATYGRMLRYRNERDAARQGWAKAVARAAREQNDREQARLDPPPLQGVLTEKMRMRFQIWPN